MSKIYKIKVSSSVEDISYEVFAPDLGVRVCDEAMSHTGKNENDAIAKMRRLCVAGYSVLVIANGTIISVDGIPREKIPNDFLLENVDAWLGDMLVVKSRLDRENFVFEIDNG